ncbi:transmembrane protein, putative [Medicago truncatula]|uniref:Transmembrane protein, putative n=1 Tax=Medicago truncatula TaxID=3880 RepID=G7IFL7_MEDTR|nr:transmembrane protein, putative [Medicago truncatula]
MSLRLLCGCSESGRFGAEKHLPKLRVELEFWYLPIMSFPLTLILQGVRLFVVQPASFLPAKHIASIHIIIMMRDNMH